MATSEGHCSQNVNISLVLQILFDGLFSGQSGHSSKELLCLKNLVLAHSIFDDTSNEKRLKMKNPPQIQTQIQICIFQNIALALGGSITFRERALPSLGFWRLLSSPQKPKLSASNPRNRDSGFSPNPYYLCIWSPMMTVPILASRWPDTCDRQNYKHIGA